MNVAIRRVAVAAMVMVVALLLQLTWVQVFRADELRADPRNTRMLLDEYSRQRGQITAGGRVLAMSLPSEGRFEFERTYPTDPEVFGPTVGYYSLQFATAEPSRWGGAVIAVGAIGTLVAVLRLQGLWIPGVPGA